MGMPEIFKISNETKLNMRVTRYLIEECVDNLRKDGESFISDINSSLAWQCRKRIKKHFENEDVIIKSYPADIEFNGTEHKGYLFRVIKNE